MSIEENKALVRRYFELSNEIKGDPSKVQALAEEFLAPEFVAHHSMLADMNVEQYVATYNEFFAVYRIANGKFVENWGLVDSLAHMQQLGLIPSMKEK